MTSLPQNKNRIDPYQVAISSKIMDSLSHVTNKYYIYLLTQMGDIDTSSRIIENLYDRYSFALTHLKKGMAIDRLLFRCLKYIKGHAGALRRGSGKPVRVKDCGFVLASIDDLIVALREIHFPDVAEEMVKFYDEYLGALSTNGINPKLFDDAPETKPPVEPVKIATAEPPKYKTMSWYWTEGYQNFFAGRIIRFLKGDRAYEDCIVKLFGTDSMMCEYKGTLTLVSNDTPLTWG